MGKNVANIDVKTLQELFTWPGKLLHRIHNCHFIPSRLRREGFIFNAQIIKQFAVSFLMYSCLKSPKVDGDSIGNLVIQGFYDTFPWAHCLFLCHLLSHLIIFGQNLPRCATTYHLYLPGEAM